MDYEFFEKVDMIVRQYDVKEINTVDVVNGHDKVINDVSVDELFNILSNNKDN
jgi:hypothetical protein